MLYLKPAVLLVAEPLLPSLVTTLVAAALTVTSGKEAPAVNSGVKLVKLPVKGVWLVSPPTPAIVVQVKLKL